MNFITMAAAMAVMSSAGRSPSTLFAAAQDCSTTSANRCLAMLDSGQPSAVIPLYSTAVVTSVCSKLSLFGECMKSVTPYCQQAQRALYKGIADGYDFICNSGFEDYKHYQPCFSNTDVQREANSCNETLQTKMSSLRKMENVTAAYRTARMCQYSDDYLDCVGNVLKSFCTVGAATWQRKFDMKQLCPLLVDLGCPGWTTQCQSVEMSSSTTATSRPVQTETWFLIVLSVSIAVVIIIIVVSLIILVCHCRRSALDASSTDARSSGRGDQPRRSSVGSMRGIDMPPPYPGPFIPCGIASPLDASYASTDDELLLIQNGGGVLSAVVNSASSSVEASGGTGGLSADDRELGAVGGIKDARRYPPRSSVDSFSESKTVPLDVAASAAADNEGFFVPDAVDMDAKLADAIPPPSTTTTKKASRHGGHRHHRHQQPQQQQQPPQLHQYQQQRSYQSSSTPNDSLSFDSSISGSSWTVSPPPLEIKFVGSPSETPDPWRQRAGPAADGGRPAEVFRLSTAARPSSPLRQNSNSIVTSSSSSSNNSSSLSSSAAQFIPASISSTASPLNSPDFILEEEFCYDNAAAAAAYREASHPYVDYY